MRAAIGRPEARAGFLRAEERVEQPLLDFGRDPPPVVSHLQNDRVRLAPAERGACRARAQRDRARTVNGLGRVANQVDEHLLQMAAIGADEQLRAGFDHQLQSTALQVRGHQPLNFADHGVGSDGFQLGF